MRIAIISDIHEDIVNLQRALDKIERLQCDEIVCLGDISGYSAAHHDYLKLRNASECLQLVRKHCSVIISGNHDLHAARKTPTHSDFKYPDNWYTMDYRQRAKIAQESVWLYEHEELDALYTHEEVKYIAELPEFEVKNYANTPMLFSHFIYPNLTGSDQMFYFKPEDYAAHAQFMQYRKATYSFAGHRHFGGLMVISNSTLITKNFGRKYHLKKGDIVLTPAITRAGSNSGFLLFDQEECTVKTVKI